MEFNALYLILWLYVGAFITWATETLGSIIKIIGMSAKKNLIFASVVQSISVFSRLGFFMQALSIAWIVDQKILMDSRLELAFGYLFITFISVFLTHFFGLKLVTQVYTKINRVAVNSIFNDVKIISIYENGSKPKLLQIIGYVMLYAGGFFPILLQLIFPEFAARGVALASIVNGLSTIILVSFYDLKTSMEIQEAEVSNIPIQLIYSRYAAIMIILIFGFILYFNSIFIFI